MGACGAREGGGVLSESQGKEAAQVMVRMRDAFRAGRSAAEYWSTVQPAMDALLRAAHESKLSILKVYQDTATPWLNRPEDKSRLWALTSAVVEIYEWRERVRSRHQ